jgi:putative ABC transport system permease protein
LTIQRHQRIMAALSALPGVTSVAMSFGLPGTAASWPTEFHMISEPELDSVRHFATERVVTAGYFHTLGIPILSGETCRMETGRANPFTVLVNRKFADRFLPGRNPIGHTIMDVDQLRLSMRIVGVTGDVNEDGHGKEAQPVIYGCGYLRWFPNSDYLVQTRGDPAAMTSAVRDTVRNLEPDRAVYAVTPLTSLIDRTLAPNRFRTLLVSLFSGLALLLAAVGLYGVMAYMVTERTREIGIRLALGAQRGQIVFEVLRSGVGMTAAGSAAGVVLAIQASSLANTLLYGVHPLDGITYVTAAVVLLATALLACLIPGRRAASVDPVRALRDS